jgi:hypothetical protein
MIRLTITKIYQKLYSYDKPSKYRFDYDTQAMDIS